MAILEIFKYPASVLREKAAVVNQSDLSVRKLVADMLETMYGAPGVGLAAPQVGVLQRIVVIDVATEDKGKDPLILINPEIIHSDGEMITGEEGCLSIPEVWGDVSRFQRVRLKFFDLAGIEHELTAENLLARVIQHEVDHLDGVLFIDRMSKIKRDLLKMKLRKKAKLAARE
ncbi:MAG: peptide deformylase [bacterium]